MASFAWRYRVRRVELQEADVPDEIEDARTGRARSRTREALRRYGEAARLSDGDAHDVSVPEGSVEADDDQRVHVGRLALLDAHELESHDRVDVVAHRRCGIVAVGGAGKIGERIGQLMLVRARHPAREQQIPFQRASPSLVEIDALRHDGPASSRASRSANSQ